MNLAEQKASYAAGELDKQDYIARMHDLHSRLFEYPALLSETDIERIEITIEGVVMSFKQTGIRMACDPRDARIAPIEALNFGHYEKTEAELVLQLIQPGSTVFDIGANIGWYSLNIAKRIPDVRVFAFEPIPDTFAQLCGNVQRNNITNIEPQNLGLSDQTRVQTFYFCDDSSVSASAANIAERSDAQELSCPVTTLDDFADAHGLKVDFIKCDVEGAELHVFRGARKCLKSHRPVVLAEMLRKWCRKFDYHPNEMIGLFAELGYACFIPAEHGLQRFESMDDETIETNFFFLHQTEHQQLFRELAEAA